MKQRIQLLTLLILTALPSATTASGNIALRDTLVYCLPEILVTGERISQVEELKSRPAFIAIIPMDDASRRVSSAADYLARTVGCHVRSTGGYGAYSTASVRGSSGKQVRVFLDGIPLNQSQSGIVDLTDVPISSLSRIEVYRGFGPFDLSGSSIGGVINLVTKKPEDKARGQLSVSYGSLSTQKYHGSYSFSTSEWNVLTVGEVLSTRGNFEFLDDNGTPYNEDDDEIAERINSQLDEYEALLKATGPLGGGTLAASNQFYYRRQGLPGYGVLQSATERMTKTYNLTHLAWDKRPCSRLPLRLVGGFYYLYQMDHFEDRQPKTVGAKPDEKNRTVSLGGSLRWKVPFPEYCQFLRGLVTVSRESFRPEEIFTETVTGEKQTRKTLVVTLEDELRLLRGRVRLIPSGRYERYTDHIQPFEEVRADMAHYYRGLTETDVIHTQTFGRVAVVISPGGGLRLKANYGRYYRIPSLMELFGYRGMVVPNPTLEPEVGLNCDLGAAWEKHFSGGTFISAEYVYFWSDVEKLIMFVYVPFARASQAINIDSADIDGYEVSLSCGGWHGATLSGNVTYLRAINTGPISYTNGKRLPNRPELEAFVRLQWERRPLSVFYEFDYVSGNYWNAYNGVAPNNKGPLFPVRRIHSAGITVPAGFPRTDFSLEVRNIADKRYEDVMGYPLPGRSIYGTVAFEF